MARLYYAAIALMMLSVPKARAAEAPLPWLPNILSDHMVVQAGQAVPLWGRDVPGTQVTVNLAGAQAQAVADASGAWKLLLPKLTAGGPYALTVAGSTTRTVQDVLVGELWLASGQSNMELAMRATKDRGVQIPAASDPQLRLFTVERTASDRLEDDVHGSWQVCSPQSVKDFSAVAYHFARSLRAELKRPVGILVSSWGGTPAEDWTPRAALEKEPAVKDELARWDADAERQALWKEGQSFELLVQGLRLLPKDPKGQPLNIAVGPAAAGELGGSWRHSEKSDSDGSFQALTNAGGVAGRYAGHIHGGSWASLQGSLKGGAGVDLSAFDAVELQVKGHGHFLPTFGQPSISDYDFYAGEAFELGDDWRTLRIPLEHLKQGGWGQPKAFTLNAIHSLNFGVQAPYWPELGALAFNGMIHPLAALPIQGVLWYQGEGNAGRAHAYQGLLSAMIQSWRENFHQPQLPFYIVQLPGWSGGAHQWGALREAQRQVGCQPHNGLVSTLAWGESQDIHPKDKRPVGEALAALALSEAYGHREPSALTPRLKPALVQGPVVELSFDHAEKGLALKGDGGFEIAGDDGNFHPAMAQRTAHGVRLSAAEVPAPKQVRHAWADDPQAYASAQGGLSLPTFLVTLP